MFRIIICLALAVPCLPISAQVISSPAKWTVGTNISNVQYQRIDSAGNKSIASFQQLQGKVVILDFWATWCGSCVSHLPQLAALQDIFRDSIVILAVNTENDDTFRQWLSTRNKLKKENIRLPFISKRSGLDTLVNFISVPHYAWIDQQGKIISFTSSLAVTEKNIRSVLRGERVDLPEKKDSVLHWSHKELLFRNGNGGNGEALLHSSVLSGYIEGMPSGTYVSDFEQRLNTILVMNLDMRELYQLAYQDAPAKDLMSVGIHFSRVELKTKDSTRYVGTVNGEIIKNNLYNYQLVSPGATYYQLRQLMQDDLKQHFHCKVRFVKRKIKCLVLSATDTTLLGTKGGKRKSMITPTEIHFVNHPFSLLERYLTSTYSQIAVVSDVRKTGNIDIRLEQPINELAHLNQQLKKYHLQLTEEVRRLDVLQIIAPD